MCQAELKELHQNCVRAAFQCGLTIELTDALNLCKISVLRSLEADVHVLC